MRALLLSNLFPSEREPTRGVFNLHRFKALSQHCEVRVVSPIPWWSRAKRPAEISKTPAETWSGLQATYPTYWSLPRAQSLHARGLALSLRGHLVEVRKQFPFDVILTAWAYPDGAAAARLARDFDCPLVTMVLGSDVNEFARHEALRDQITTGLKAAARVVTVSDALREKVIELGVDPLQVLVQRNCVDGERFALRDRDEARKQLGLKGDRLRLCYIGNWVPEKGVEVMIEAMGLLQRPDVELLMVGSGPLEEKLRRRASDLGISDRIRFHGRRPHAEIPVWMAAADSLCLPSFREGCPNVILEALASGRPVIASKVGGIPELLDAQNGLLVPPGDAQRLADGIDEVLSREWSPKALRNTVQFLSWTQYGLTLQDCLQHALEEHRTKTSLKATLAAEVAGRA